jgi:signal transduction histidine kinase
MFAEKLRSTYCALITIGSVAVATIIRALIHLVFHQQLPYTPFVPAIMLTALFCGELWGVLATALSMVAACFWMIGNGESRVSETNDLIAMALFAAAAALIVWLSAKVRRHRFSLERAAEERERLLASEQAARIEAEQANRAKDNFFAAVTHELRNPLSSILGWAYLLRNGNLNADEFKSAVDSIERGAKIQTQLVDDLLDLSRIRTGKLRLSMKALCLTEIVGSAVESMIPAARAKGIEVDYKQAKAVSPILGDETRLQQVVWNLLTNALKFTPSGRSIRIELTDRGKLVELVVSDTGEGIEAENLPRIFDHFHQTESGAQRGGLGLGLAIVNEIIELHGGSIRATSGGKDKGSEFRIELPKLHPQITSKSEGATEMRSRHSHTALAGQRSLAIDDV